MSTAQSPTTFEVLEDHARQAIQSWIQGLLDEEITAPLGRARHERRAAVDGAEGHRNGHGKPRRLAMLASTVTVRGPHAKIDDPTKPPQRGAGRVFCWAGGVGPLTCPVPGLSSRDPRNPAQRHLS
jgi:hypothetical protein